MKKSLLSLTALTAAVILLAVSVCSCGEKADTGASVSSSGAAVNSTVSADTQLSSNYTSAEVGSSSLADSSKTGVSSASGTSSTNSSASPSSAISSKPTVVSKQQVSSGTVSTVSSKPTVSSEKPAVKTLTPLSNSNYYGRTYLSGKSNGKALVLAYDRIVAGVANMDKSINLNDASNRIKISEIDEVYAAYFSDYPQHFWVTNGYKYSYMGDYVMTVEPTYTGISKSQLSSAKDKFSAAVTRLLTGISGSSSEYDRELAIHNRLAAACKYASSTNCHTAYGALVDGTAVCEGYARAFQYLCYQAGIQCLFITGSSNNPSTGSPEPHAWNAVKIGGSYYHMDMTWDDADNSDGGILHYAYFNVTTSQIKEDHAIGTSGYPAPNCTATKYNYFVKNGTVVSTYTVDSVAKLLKASGNRTLRVYVTSDYDSFVNWMRNNYQAVAKSAGISKIKGYAYASLGRELYFEIK